MEMNLKKRESETAAHEPIVKRPKSRGELLFDWSVYGGLGWVVNALLSVFVTHKLMHGTWKPFGDQCIRGIETGIRSVSNLVPSAAAKRAGEYMTKGSNDIFLISALFLGGTALVIPMRMLEAGKSRLVRWTDKWLSKDADPVELERAHQAMDSAPQQSWKSLLEGRVAALGLALALSPLIGKWDSLSSTALSNTPLRDFGSMERASVNISNGVARGFKPSTQNVHYGQPLKDQVNPSIIKSAMMIYDLTLSSITAVFFYFSTRFFARGMDAKKSPELAGKTMPLPEKSAAAPGLAAPAAEPSKPATTKPGLKVNSISREQHLANVADVNRMIAG